MSEAERNYWLNCKVLRVDGTPTNVYRLMLEAMKEEYVYASGIWNTADSVDDFLYDMESRRLYLNEALGITELEPEENKL